MKMSMSQKKWIDEILRMGKRSQEDYPSGCHLGLHEFDDGNPYSLLVVVSCTSTSYLELFLLGR